MLIKCCSQYVSKFGKLGSGHRTGKGQFSFQSQRRANNFHTTLQLWTFNMIVSFFFFNSFKLGFSSMCVTWELPDVIGFQRNRITRDRISNIPWIIAKAKEFQKKTSTSTSASLTMLKTLCGSRHLWKILKATWILDNFTCLLRNMYVCQKEQL